MPDGVVTDPLAGQVVGKADSLSPWAEPYTYGMLNWGISNLIGAQYPSYTGSLSAPASSLQNLAFTGYPNLTTPDFTGLQSGMGNIASSLYGSTYTPSGALTTGRYPDFYQEYMSPYIEGVVQPQIAEARRQSDISGEQQASRMAKAGSFGGGRQAIMDAERERNFQQQVENITGQGYQRAYEQGLQAFTADQARALDAAKFGESANQFAAQYGMQALNNALNAFQSEANLLRAGYQLDADRLSQLLTAGGIERGIEADEVAAQLRQFEMETGWPLKNIALYSSLLSGLPLGQTIYDRAESSTFAQMASVLGFGLEGLNELKELFPDWEIWGDSGDGEP